MQIMDHLIESQQIIGISPLYQQADKDKTMYQLYKSFKYIFFIHTRQQSIEIASNTFYPENATSDKEKNEKHQQQIKSWKDEYYTIRAKIEMMIDARMLETKNDLSLIDLAAILIGLNADHKPGDHKSSWEQRIEEMKAKKTGQDQK